MMMFFPKVVLVCIDDTSKVALYRGYKDDLPPNKFQLLSPHTQRTASWLSNSIHPICDARSQREEGRFGSLQFSGSIALPETWNSRIIDGR